jgi:hypothetical protein
MEVAKDSIPHVKTAFLYHSRPMLHKLPTSIDHQARTPTQFMRYMNAA